jgi:hypothetical protein
VVIDDSYDSPYTYKIKNLWWFAILINKTTIFLLLEKYKWQIQFKLY